ncbi:protein of unknown function (plasmid) [Cupriavidus taiwanensis]|uniref:Uncharacterized protein n=1 Tax=Cupriavidus taiwanensis TaxID=164546 RepID=A0A375IJ29_9BURK|nr:hypothetical protein CBM2608_B100102 [Cupriavidus taiwanensis]SPA36678.1 hypothetical protein CBM2623_B90103 [Cupriavidus taiwanensis]SPK74744.1 protein of unknown function [Cupriavidus taiwanensis]
MPGSGLASAICNLSLDAAPANARRRDSEGGPAVDPDITPQRTGSFRPMPARDPFLSDGAKTLPPAF